MAEDKHNYIKGEIFRVEENYRIGKEKKGDVYFFVGDSERGLGEVFGELSKSHQLADADVDDIKIRVKRLAKGNSHLIISKKTLETEW
jgi:UPF0288 family protein (methanogenesis marker protein 3)